MVWADARLSEMAGLSEMGYEERLKTENTGFN